MLCRVEKLDRNLAWSATAKNDLFQLPMLPDAPVLHKVQFVGIHECEDMYKVFLDLNHYILFSFDTTQRVFDKIPVQ